MKASLPLLLLACVASTRAFAADPAFTTPAPQLPPQQNEPVFFEPGTRIGGGQKGIFFEPPPPMFLWTGLYAGGNFGYAFNGNTSYALSGTDPLTAASLASGNRPTAFATRANGFTGGAQLGYNKEFASALVPTLNGKGGGFVIGVEADAAYTDLSAFGTYAGTDGSRTNLHERTGLVGTLRARAGVAFDKLLVFGTGGLAFGSINAAGNTFAPGGVNDFSGAGSSIRTGYVFGGGIEYAIPTMPLLKELKVPAVTLKVEFLHYDLGSSVFAANSTLGAGSAYNVRIHNDGNLVRAGVNYKFDPTEALGKLATPQ